MYILIKEIRHELINYKLYILNYHIKHQFREQEILILTKSQSKSQIYALLKIIKKNISLFFNLFQTTTTATYANTIERNT